MVITIENDSQTLLELLWIREAWQLHPVGDDLPPALVETPSFVGESKRSSAPITQWQDAWPNIWNASVHHAGTSHDPRILEQLHGSKIGSEERRRLLGELVGPSWRDSFGADAFTEDEQQWNYRMFRQRVDRSLRQWDEQPERVALDVLIASWQSGLTKIVEIPCRGTFTRVIGKNALLVTVETRADAERYREALTKFH